MLERLWIQIWAAVVSFGNSNFGVALVSAFIGSLAGAWGGAWAAQRIAERARVRSQLLQEIRDSNAGIELSYVVCNAYLNLKEQCLQALCDEYENQKARVDAHQAGMRQGTIRAGTVLDIGELNLSTIDLVRARTDVMEKVVMKRLSVSGRPRPLVSILTQTMESLNGAIRDRNELVKQLNVAGISQNAKMATIFAVPRDDRVDARFMENVRGMYSQNDACIYFSWRLCEDIAAHGNRVREQFLGNFRGPVANINKVDWSGAKKKGLLPEIDDYASWETGFPKRVDWSRGRWIGKGKYWLQRWWRKLLRAISRW